MLKSPSNILVTTYFSLDDALIQTYTLPYVEEMLKHKKVNKVYLLTINKGIPDENKIDELRLKSIEILCINYDKFGPVMIFRWLYWTIKLWFFILIKRISVIHGWCSPGGAIGYLLSVTTGKKLVLDSFEPHADIMLESNTWNVNSLAFKILFKLEKLQIKRASKVITCVKSMNNYVLERYNFNLKNYYTKPACIDFSLFSQNKINDPFLIDGLNLKGKVVMVYAGKFGGSYYKSEIFRLAVAAQNYWGLDKFRFLLLSNHPESELKCWMNETGFDSVGLIKKFVNHSDVPKYIGVANFGLVPFIPVPSKRYGTPIKTGEYWAMGLPVIVTPNISDDSGIIKRKNIGSIWEDTSEDGCLKSIKKIDELLNLEDKDQLRTKIIATAKKYRNFSIAKEVYNDIYGS